MSSGRPPHETKVRPLADLKVLDAGPGGFTGYASRWEELDSEGDVVAKGAYADTLEPFVERGFIALGHDWTRPVATIKAAREDAWGLWLEAEFHSDPQSQAARTLVAERKARGKFMGLSIGYLPLDFERTEKGRRLTRIELFETSLVTVPALASAGVLAAKAASSVDGLELRAEWSAAMVNDLPDSAFAYVEPGGSKDDEGKTTPRSLRHFPHHGADGSPDAAHVRNALARIPQSDVSPAAKASALAHVRRHAAAMDIGTSALEPDALEEKVGRRLSAASERRIREALDVLRELLGEGDDQEGAPSAAEASAGAGQPGGAPAPAPADDLLSLGERLATELAGYASRLTTAAPVTLSGLVGAAGYGAMTRRLAVARARLDDALERAADPDGLNPETLRRRFALVAERFAELDLPVPEPTAPR